jgi:hypothetical protein
MTPLGIESATFRLVTQCLNQLCYRVPPNMHVATIKKNTVVIRKLSRRSERGCRALRPFHSFPPTGQCGLRIPVYRVRKSYLLAFCSLPWAKDRKAPAVFSQGNIHKKTRTYNCALSRVRARYPSVGPVKDST